MKFVPKAMPDEIANASAGKGSQLTELFKLILIAAALLIAIYVVVATSVDVMVAWIPPESEAAWFSGVFNADSDSTVADTPELKERFARVQAIFKELCAHPDVAPVPYTLVLLDETMPNALAIPGGTIALTSGLLQELESDGAFAFVLGHELGHFRNRDHLRGIGRQLGFGLIVAIVFGDSDVFVTRASEQVLLKYSREQERAADRFGLRIVYETYGNADEAETFFRNILAADHLPGWAYMFSTHPDTQERIASLRAYLAELKADTPPASAGRE